MHQIFASRIKSLN